MTAKIERWEDRDAPCPERGPGLSHVQNGTPECLFCGVFTVSAAEPSRRRSRRKRERVEVEFTDDEIRKLEFLRYLRRAGRI